jgi:hypothetical protein
MGGHPSPTRITLGRLIRRYRDAAGICSSVNPHSMGAFILATVDGGEVAYVETAVRGMVTSSRDDIACLSDAWESIRTFALPQQESIEFIKRTAEERWT